MFWIFAQLKTDVKKMKAIVTITMNAKVALNVVKTIVLYHLDMIGVLIVATSQLKTKSSKQLFSSNVSKDITEKVKKTK